MRALLDSHTLLWALSAPKKLPAKSRGILTDPDHAVYVSAASIWEICIKVALKKLDAKPQEILEEARAIGFQELPILGRHGLRLLQLKPYHRDPFDRMLVAQAQEEGLTLITRDSVFAHYDVPVLWD